MPRFTVVCPTYNRGAAILPTLESVRSQSLTDWELLVASDASDDDTDAVVAEVASRDARVRLLRTERFGSQSGPTNRALEQAQGDCIAYLDHDDVWDPRHLELLSRALAGGADFAATRCRTVDLSGSVTSTAAPVTMCWHPELQLMGPLFENSRAGHRAGLAESVGGWRESPIGLEDWDLWLRFADAGAVCATSLACTVTILEAPFTRRHRMQAPFRHALARFADMRSAREGFRTLTAPRHHRAVLRATRDDLMAWYEDLAADGSLVYPDGWPAGADALQCALDAHLTAAEAAVTELARNLVIEPDGDGYSISSVVPTMTREHADRYGALFRSRMSHQMAFLDEVLPTDSVLR